MTAGARRPMVAASGLPRTARFNPFRSECVTRLAFRNPAFDRAGVLARWEASGRRGAIVGSHGHGKTTLLDECLADLTAAGEIVLREKLSCGQRRIPRSFLEKVRMESSRHAVVVLDGAEQLPWWRWRRFVRSLRQSQGCLITSHRDGQLPCLAFCDTSVELLLDLVTELQGPLSAEQKADLDQLFHTMQGDIRLCLRELYERYSDGRWG